MKLFKPEKNAKDKNNKQVLRVAWKELIQYIHVKSSNTLWMIKFTTLQQNIYADIKHWFCIECLSPTTANTCRGRYSSAFQVQNVQEKSNPWKYSVVLFFLCILYWNNRRISTPEHMKPYLPWIFKISLSLNSNVTHMINGKNCYLETQHNGNMRMGNLK